MRWGTNRDAETETLKGVDWVKNGRGMPPPGPPRRLKLPSAESVAEPRPKTKTILVLSIALPISHVFKAVWNKEPDRVGRYRLCAAPKSAEKKVLLEVEGARAPAPHSWQRQ